MLGGKYNLCRVYVVHGHGQEKGTGGEGRVLGWCG